MFGSYCMNNCLWLAVAKAPGYQHRQQWPNTHFIKLHDKDKSLPLGLSNDKNLGLQPRFLSTESLGQCFSHGMGDHDQILQYTSPQTTSLCRGYNYIHQNTWFWSTSNYVGKEDMAWNQNQLMAVTDSALQLQMLSVLNFKHVDFIYFFHINIWEGQQILSKKWTFSLRMLLAKCLPFLFRSWFVEDWEIHHVLGSGPCYEICIIYKSNVLNKAIFLIFFVFNEIISTILMVFDIVNMNVALKCEGRNHHWWYMHGQGVRNRNCFQV